MRYMNCQHTIHFYLIKFIIGLLSFALLVSCHSHQVDLRAERQTRDHLIIAIGSEPEGGFDPTSGWGSYGSPLFQSTLLKRDSSLNMINDLATDVQVSADGTVWTVIIRSDATFSDGMPLTAKDVQFTYETAKQSASLVDLSNLLSVEARGKDEVVFVLAQPQSTFRGQLATIGIVPQHAYDDQYSQHPIGSGPFKFVQWDKGQQLIIEANPSYYGEQPFFQKITLLFLNMDTAYAAAQSGQVDIAYIPSLFSERVPEGMRLQSIQTVDNRGIMFPYVPSGFTTEEGIPIGHDVTAHRSIRQAINVAIDRQALVDGLFNGYAAPAYSVNDHLPWWNEDMVFADGDLDQAAKLLHEDGWEDIDGDGILEKDGLKASLTLLYPASDVSRQSLALAVADMLKPIGIEMKTEGKSWNDIQKLMHSHAVLFGFGSHDPLEMYHLHSSQFQGVAYYNPGFYHNEQVDHWLELAMQATSEEEANRYWQRAQWDGNTGFAFKGDAPWAWLVNIDHLYLVTERLNMGSPKIQPHGHDWPLLDNVVEWRWEER